MKPKPAKNRVNDCLLLLISCLLPIMLSACFGVSMDISLNKNGSGTLSLEYQIARSLDSLRKLDGNERWNTIPIGKADFDRTIDRLEGMKMLSYSQKETENQILVKVKMSFETPDALMSFLNADGRRCSFSGNGDSGTLNVKLSDGYKPDGLESRNSAFYEFLSDISKPYNVNLSMSFPGEGSLIITSASGVILKDAPEIEIKGQGRNVSCSFPLNTIISSREGINLEFRW